jgi:hypothetical protein
MLQVTLEIVSQPQRGEHLLEGPVMQRLGIHENAVAVEYYCLEVRIGVGLAIDQVTNAPWETS